MEEGDIVHLDLAIKFSCSTKTKAAWKRVKTYLEDTPPCYTCLNMSCRCKTEPHGERVCDYQDNQTKQKDGD